MAESPAPNPSSSDAPGAGGAGGGFSLRRSWQLPLLAGGVMLLASGIVAAFLTKPKTDLMDLMDRAEAMMRQSQYRSAVEYLGEKVFPYRDSGRMTGQEAGRYHLLMARGIYRGARELGIRDPRNDVAILKEYGEAEHFGAALEVPDHEALIETHLAMGALDKAEAIIEHLPEGLHAERTGFLKRVVVQALTARPADQERALRLIAGLLADPRLEEGDRIWAVGEQARLALERGAPEEAINQILRTTPRLATPSGDALAGLLTQLGRAYMMLPTPEVDEAYAQLMRALEFYNPSNPDSAEALLVTARVDVQRGRLDEARERLHRLEQWFASTDWHLPAILTMAELESAAGNLDASLERYEALVALAREGPLPRWISREEIAESLVSESAARLSAQDHERASLLALMALDLTGLEEAPAGVLRAIAEADLRAADALMPVERGTSEAVFALSEMDPSARAQVRRHLIRAASYLRQYAERMVLTDRAAYGRALWDSADAYDRAGDTEEAIRAFHEYVDSFPDEARRAEARYRLAQAHQARGEMGEAEALYRELVEARGNPAERDVGEFGDRSVIALARTLLADTDAGNDGEAERLLVEALSGREVGFPESERFREALLELGLVYYRSGRYPEAIARLEEAIDRYPQDPRMVQVRYRLADAMRLSAREAAALLQTELTPTRRREVEELRAERLRGAVEMFRRARDEMEAMPSRRRSILDEEYLRNSYYFLGSCAFDMQDYRGAIEAYDAARERYPRDPASLVALVQIVNAYVELGELDRARTANERARMFYASLPEEVWNDPYLPMGRQEWQRWLDSMAALYAGADGE